MIPGKSVLLGNGHCPGCGLDWLSGEALAAFLPTAHAFEKLRATAAAGDASARRLLCPTCRAESFHIVRADSALIDVCRKCVGVALDPGELRAIKSMGPAPTKMFSDLEDAAEAVSWVAWLAHLLCILN